MAPCVVDRLEREKSGVLGELELLILQIVLTCDFSLSLSWLKYHIKYHIIYGTWNCNPFIYDMIQTEKQKSRWGEARLWYCRTGSGQSQRPSQNHQSDGSRKSNPALLCLDTNAVSLSGSLLRVSRQEVCGAAFVEDWHGCPQKPQRPSSKRKKKRCLCFVDMSQIQPQESFWVCVPHWIRMRSPIEFAFCSPEVMKLTAK